MQDKRLRYPETREEIDVTNYTGLIHKVFNDLVGKFGDWIRYQKQDLIQTGYIGLIKAKEKYVPGRGSFLGLAYLRIRSAMQTDIVKYSKFYSQTTQLENIRCSGSNDDDGLDWESTFGEVILNYHAVFSMVTDEDDRKLLVGLIELYPYWKLRAILKETKEDHEVRVYRLKQELRDIVDTLHNNKSL